MRAALRGLSLAVRSGVLSLESVDKTEPQEQSEVCLFRRRTELVLQTSFLCTNRVNSERQRERGTERHQGKEKITVFGGTNRRNSVLRA